MLWMNKVEILGFFHWFRIPLMNNRKMFTQPVKVHLKVLYLKNWKGKGRCRRKSQNPKASTVLISIMEQGLVVKLNFCAGGSKVN